MSSIYDLYMKDNIMSHCEEYFREYLEKEDALDEDLTDTERDIIRLQIDSLTNMIVRTYHNHEDESDALAEIVDQLIGFCIVGKMNELRFCRLLHEAKGVE